LEKGRMAVEALEGYEVAVHGLRTKSEKVAGKKTGITKLGHYEFRRG